MVCIELLTTYKLLANNFARKDRKDYLRKAR